ncbi:hypothetical protein SAMN04487948_10763 [Halogranum amylolyticum]|uniref:Uncharacterized protein n=1 Tax=Halogranum amylolyticum TaxID=660520 RepID=A0A1H8TH75_9EURY|nr:hypothetical protein [Halogranum amylolyticum]SEO90479.1 hypothetical protein SAMN04487948_10763 [Halogranum amylolyticum]
MTTKICNGCGETVPAARYCEECHAPLTENVVPPSEEYERDFTTRMNDAAVEATHDSVSFDTLRSDHGSYDRPLGGYLFASERPAAVCELSSVRLSADSTYSSELATPFLTDGHLVVTRDRLVAVLPREGETQLFDVSMADIVDVEAESKLLGGALVVSLASGFTVTYDLDASDELLTELTDGIQRLEARDDSTESRAAKFVQTVDDEIAAATDAETALRNVADRFATRDEVTAFDHAVASADSVDELLDAIAEGSDAPDASASRQRPEPATNLPTPSTGPTAGALRTRVAGALRNADPQEVGKYTLAATLGLGTYAISAPFSTTLGLAALAAGGTATGLYATANPESVVAQADPMELVMSMNHRGRHVSHSSIAGTANAGRLLGAAEYLGDLEYDTAYAQWLVEADIDTVVRAAEVAQRHAKRNPEFGTEREASLLGAIGGLAYGYTDDDGGVESFFDEDVTAIDEDTTAIDEDITAVDEDVTAVDEDVTAADEE